MKKRSTLLLSFTKQLQQLMDSIRTTRSHFIRCIKPNSVMSSAEYNHRLVMSQLRCGGVLGAIQVFRAGFPNRFHFSQFVERYSILAYVVGAQQKQRGNPLTRDFYVLKRRAIENNLEAFYWKRCCEVLMRLVPLAQVILDAIGIPGKGQTDMGRPTTSRTTALTSLELLHASAAYFSQERADKGQEMSIGKKQIFLRASYYEYLESLLYRSNTMVASIMQYNWRYKSQQYLRSLHLSSAKVLMVHHFVHMFSIQSSRAFTNS
jgi:myosin heavy subunit